MTLVDVSRLSERIQQITGRLPAILLNTDGGFIATVRHGERDLAVWGDDVEGALEGLRRWVEWGPEAAQKGVWYGRTLG
jgi:hypothetical protein